MVTLEAAAVVGSLVLIALLLQAHKLVVKKYVIPEIERAEDDD